jgi:hypothetical protein
MSKKIDTRSLRRLLPDPNRFVCSSFAPGHNVHWIQSLQSANTKAISVQTWPGKVVAVEGELLTVRQLDGSHTLFRTHDPARLVVILEHIGIDVTVNDQMAILRAGITRSGSYCISVQVDTGELLAPCPTGDMPADMTPAQRDVRTHGGFAAPSSRQRCGTPKPAGCITPNAEAGAKRQQEARRGPAN